MNANLTTRSFKLLLEHAGLPSTVRFHDLRHTCATLHLSRNVNPKIVQEMLGHANISETMDTYSRFLPGISDAAAGLWTRLWAICSDSALARVCLGRASGVRVDVPKEQTALAG